MKINYDVHALAHLKCKEQMCRRTNNRLKAKLLSCMHWKTHFQEKIYQGKLKHNAFARELNKLKHDGTLRHYPLLLLDYDDTVKELQAKREKVEKLRNNYNNLVNRIEIAEQLLESTKKSARASRRGSHIIHLNPAVVVTQLKLT